ncbi:MAG: tetratricopeptide repeat protein [Methanophagales archaeon]|nr:tetratricopeptide repeat protein [Methanophagales archaeon]
MAGNVAMEIEFRKKLLSILGEAIRREEIEKIEKDDSYIEALAWQFRVETANSIMKISTGKPGLKDMGKETFETFFQRQAKKFSNLSSEALSTVGNSLAYALLLFFSDSLANLYFQPEATDWLKKAKERYSAVAPLEHLFAVSLSSSRLFGRYPDISPDIDPLKIMYESVRKAPESIISMFETYTNLRREYFKKYPQITELFYDSLKNVYPDVPRESINNTITSVDLIALADYYRIAGKKEDSKRTVEDSLSFWKENSYSLALSGYFEMEEGNFKLARRKFSEAEKFAEKQFNGLPLKIRNFIAIYMGKSYLFYKDGLYEKSVDYCTKALDLKPEPLLKLSILIDRGRSLLEEGNLDEAYRDFAEALNLEPNSPSTHNNFGRIYYERGLCEKAKSEYEKAIDLKPDLAEAYYNLGLIYKDEDQIERAERLFETAYKLDRNFTKARYILEKIKPKGGRDWWDWWFSGTSIRKKIIGSILILLLLGSVVPSIIMFFVGKNIPNAIFGMVGIITIVLILPWIKKLEMGPLKFEAESKGEKFR